MPPLIYSLPQKLRAIESLGADALLLIHFDEEFSQQTGGEFVRTWRATSGQIHSVCVGADFVFGHKRSGNVALLKKLGGEIGFHGSRAGRRLARRPGCQQHAHPRTIRAGDLDAASQMLGRPYAISRARGRRRPSWDASWVSRRPIWMRPDWFCRRTAFIPGDHRSAGRFIASR